MPTIHVHTRCAPITGCAICYPGTRAADARPLSRCRKCGVHVEHDAAPADPAARCPAALGKPSAGLCGGELVPVAGRFEAPAEARAPEAEPCRECRGSEVCPVCGGEDDEVNDCADCAGSGKCLACDEGQQ